MIIAAYSDRIYKNTIDSNLRDMLVDCNDIKIAIFSEVSTGKKKSDEINTTYVINKYHVNTYYANMIIRDANAVMNSQKELQPIYVDDFKAKIEAQEEKIKILNQKISYWRNMKAETIAHQKIKKYKVVFPYIFKDGKVHYSGKAKNVTKIVYELWEFELYTEKRIRQIKNNLYHIKNKLNHLKQELKNMQSKLPSVCFGSKDLFKKQFTIPEYIENHKAWKKEYFSKRHYRFSISGCSGFVDGSMCVRYNADSKVLSIMSYKQGDIPKGKKYAQSQWFTVPCEFKYRKEEYLKALINRETVAYEVLDYGEYFIIKAVFEYKNDIPLINDISNGVNTIDINIDRFAIMNLDKHGNLLRRKVIYFNLDDLTSEQATKILEQKAIEISQICINSGKPLVREDIAKIKFKDTGDAKRNKQLTQFAYDKMINIIDRRLEKDGFQVYKINPKYTSKQGKLKYMQQMGLSIHEAAAMCIGRRFLFSRTDAEGKFILYYENLGKFKKFGNIQKLAKGLSKLSVNTMYKLKNLAIKPDNYKSFSKYANEVNKIIYAN